jgi:hypothetical protein
MRDRYGKALPNPKTMSFDQLEKWAFRWKEHSEGDRKYFLAQIHRYVASERLHRIDFLKFLWHHIWLRNGRGRTILYCHFSEYHQRVGYCMYFKNWALQALEKQNEILSTTP